MNEKCFNSYVKTFEDSLGNESELVIKEALNTNLNDTIYGIHMTVVVHKCEDLMPIESFGIKNIHHTKEKFSLCKQ